jgi:hypothetical protein
MNKLPYEIFPIALSDKTDSVEFENSQASTCNRITEGSATSAPTIKVHCTSFDQFLQRYSGPPSPVDAVVGYFEFASVNPMLPWRSPLCTYAMYAQRIKHDRGFTTHVLTTVLPGISIS